MSVQEIVNKYKNNVAGFITDVKKAEISEGFLNGRKINIGGLKVTYNDLLKATLKIIDENSPYDSQFITRILALSTEKQKKSSQLTRAFTWIKSNAALLFYNRNKDMDELVNRFIEIILKESEKENVDKKENKKPFNFSLDDESEVDSEESDSDKGWSDPIDSNEDKSDNLSQGTSSDSSQSITTNIPSDLSYDSNVRDSFLEALVPKDDDQNEIKSPTEKRKRGIEEDTEEKSRATCKFKKTIVQTQLFIVQRSIDNTVPFSLPVMEEINSSEVKKEEKALPREIVRHQAVKNSTDLEKVATGEKVVVLQKIKGEFFWQIEFLSKLNLDDVSGKDKWVIAFDPKTSEIKSFGKTDFPINDPIVKGFLERKGLNVQTLKALPSSSLEKFKNTSEIQPYKEVKVSHDLQPVISGEKVVVVEQKGDAFQWQIRSPSELKARDLQLDNQWILGMQNGVIKITGATLFPVEHPKVQQFIQMKGLNALEMKPVAVAQELKALPSIPKVEFSLERISFNDPKLKELFSEDEISVMKERQLSMEDLKDTVKMRMFALERYNELLKKNDFDGLMKEVLESRATYVYTEKDFKNDLFQLIQEAVVIFNSGRVGVQDAEVYCPKLGAKLSLKADENGMIENVMVENVVSKMLEEREKALQQQLNILKDRVRIAKSNRGLFNDWSSLVKQKQSLEESKRLFEERVRILQDRIDFANQYGGLFQKWYFLSEKKQSLEESKYNFENNKTLPWEIKVSESEKELIEEIKKEIETKELEIANRKNSLQDILNEIDSAKIHLEENKKRLINFTNQTNASIDFQKKKIVELNSLVVIQNEKIDDIEKDKKEIQQKISLLRDEKIQLENNKINLEKKLNFIREELEYLGKNSKSILESEIKETENKIDIHLRLIEAEKKRGNSKLVEEFQNDINSYKEEIQLKKSELEKIAIVDGLEETISIRNEQVNGLNLKINYWNNLLEDKLNEIKNEENSFNSSGVKNDLIKAEQKVRSLQKEIEEESLKLEEERREMQLKINDSTPLEKLREEIKKMEEIVKLEKTNFNKQKELNENKFKKFDQILLDYKKKLKEIEEVNTQIRNLEVPKDFEFLTPDFFGKDIKKAEEEISKITLKLKDAPEKIKKIEMQIGNLKKLENFESLESHFFDKQIEESEKEIREIEFELKGLRAETPR